MSQLFQETLALALLRKLTRLKKPGFLVEFFQSAGSWISFLLLGLLTRAPSPVIYRAIIHPDYSGAPFHHNLCHSQTHCYCVQWGSPALGKAIQTYRDPVCFWQGKSIQDGWRTKAAIHWHELSSVSYTHSLSLIALTGQEKHRREESSGCVFITVESRLPSIQWWDMAEKVCTAIALSCTWCVDN